MKIERYKVRGETKYRFRAYTGVDPVTGKRTRIQQSGFDTKQEAQLACAEAIAKAQPSRARHLTYRQVYDIWMDSYRLSVKDSTLRHVVQVFRDHILPEFGNRDIKDIKTFQLQDWMNGQAETSTRADERFRYLAKIFDFAVKNDLIDKSPATAVIRPHRQKQAFSRRDANVYTREELEKFLALAEKRLPHQWYVFFRLLAYTGMRRGEALALTWDDVDPDGMTVHISKTITTGRSGAYVSNTPKTDRSNRTILIDHETMDLILSLERKCEYIFPNTKNGFSALSVPVRMMHKAVDGSDLRYISPHGLRHTHCSLLFSAGVSIPEVQDRLGHADVKTTLDVYNHVYQKDKQNALDRFVDFMNL